MKTLRRRIAEGTLPAYRFGPRVMPGSSTAMVRSIRVRLQDLEASGHRIPSARMAE